MSEINLTLEALQNAKGRKFRVEIRSAKPDNSFIAILSKVESNTLKGNIRIIFTDSNGKGIAFQLEDIKSISTID